MMIDLYDSLASSVTDVVCGCCGLTQVWSFPHQLKLVNIRGLSGLTEKLTNAVKLQDSQVTVSPSSEFAKFQEPLTCAWGFPSYPLVFKLLQVESPKRRRV
jgi:hypothetical protein